MSDIRKVLIVGAGIGGLGAGAALAQPRRRGRDRRDQARAERLRRRHQPARQLAAGAARRSACSTRSATSASSSTAGPSTTPTATSSSTCRRSSAATAIPSNAGLTRRDLHDILIGAADRAGATVTLRHDASTEFDDRNGAAEVAAVRRARGGLRPRRRLRRHQLAAAQAAVRRRPTSRSTAATASGASRCRGRSTSPTARSTRRRARRPATSRCRRSSMYLLLVHPEPHHARFDRAQYVEHAARAPRAVRGRGRRHPRQPEGRTTTSSTRPLSEVMLAAPWFKGRRAAVRRRRARVHAAHHAGRGDGARGRGRAAARSCSTTDRPLADRAAGLRRAPLPAREVRPGRLARDPQRRDADQRREHRARLRAHEARSCPGRWPASTRSSTSRPDACRGSTRTRTSCRADYRAELERRDLMSFPLPPWSAGTCSTTLMARHAIDAAVIVALAAGRVLRRPGPRRRARAAGQRASRPSTSRGAPRALRRPRGPAAAGRRPRARRAGLRARRRSASTA